MKEFYKMSFIVGIRLVDVFTNKNDFNHLICMCFVLTKEHTNRAQSEI